MLEEIDTINRFNLFNYPIPEDNNFHYRGQLPKFNKASGNFSQLCRFVTPELDNLPKSEKYKDLYGITTYNDETIIVKCMICEENKKLSFKGDLVEADTGLRVIEYKNFWSHALNFHLCEFSISDINKFKVTKKELVKSGNKNSIKSAFLNSSKINDSSSVIERSSLSSSTATSYTNRAITTDIAYLIIYGNFPFSLIESISLREAIRSILKRCVAKITNIKFQSRRTVTRRVKEIVEEQNSEYCGNFVSLLKDESEFTSPFFPVTNDSSTSVASVHYSVMVGSKIRTTKDGSPWSLQEYYLNCSSTSALTLKAVDNYNQMKGVIKKLLVDNKIHDENKVFDLRNYLSAGYLIILYMILFNIFSNKRLLIVDRILQLQVYEN
jgi:hypothetical protein